MKVKLLDCQIKPLLNIEAGCNIRKPDITQNEDEKLLSYNRSNTEISPISNHASYKKMSINRLFQSQRTSAFRPVDNLQIYPILEMPNVPFFPNLNII